MGNLIEQLKEIENQAASTLMQATETRERLQEAYRMMNEEIEKNIEHENVQVPFAAFETQLERFQEEKRELLDRHEQEKDKIRKHYGKIIIAMAIVLTSIIIGIFGTIFYFLNNYDFVIDFRQTITAGDDSAATINDGIHYNDTAN